MSIVELLAKVYLYERLLQFDFFVKYLSNLLFIWSLTQQFLMFKFQTRSELPKNTSSIELNATHDIFQYSIDPDHHSDQAPQNNHNINETHSQKIHNLTQTQDHNKYKLQLIKLMALIKLQQLGYHNANAKSILELEMQKLTQPQNISNRKLDEQASHIVDNVVLLLIGQNGVRVRSISRAESVMEIQSIHQPIQSHQPQIQPQPIIERHRPEILCSICYLVTVQYCEERCMHSFCQSCMRGYVRQNISTGNYTIKCPQYDCTEVVSIDTIRNLLPPAQFQRYMHFKNKNQLEMNPDNKFCHKPDCGELLVRLEQGDRLTCPKCKSAYCQICLQDYHAGKGCDIILKNTLQNTYKTFKIKKCPNCKSPIEKYEGCNHINCKKCKQEFCWLCLKTYSRHHYRYYNCFGCPGMQFQNEDVLAFERCKQISFFMLAPLVLVIALLCYLAAIPVFMVGSLIYKPFAWISKGRQMFQMKLVEQVCCCCCRDQIQVIILWFLFQPRAILYSIFIAPIKITAIFCGQVCSCFQ